MVVLDFRQSSPSPRGTAERDNTIVGPSTNSELDVNTTSEYDRSTRAGVQRLNPRSRMEAVARSAVLDARRPTLLDPLRSSKPSGARLYQRHPVQVVLEKLGKPWIESGTPRSLVMLERRSGRRKWQASASIFGGKRSMRDSAVRPRSNSATMSFDLGEHKSSGVRGNDGSGRHELCDHRSSLSSGLAGSFCAAVKASCVGQLRLEEGGGSKSRVDLRAVAGLCHHRRPARHGSARSYPG